MNELDSDCPVCGSTEGFVYEDWQCTTNRVFADPITYTVVMACCPTCKESFEKNPYEAADIVKAAFAEADRTTVVNCLKYLSDKGISAASIERCLRLPQRHFQKNQGPAEAVILRMVRYYPSLLEASDEDFSCSAIQTIQT
jgi:hypothetical protein